VYYLERTLISPYISERNATELRDTIPAICSAPISLYVGTTAIAESAVRLFCWFANFTLDTTICGVSDLCVVKCRCFVDLLFDEIKCVHCRSPKRMGGFSPLTPKGDPSPRSFSRLRPMDNVVLLLE
jgi:hypothetical protein